MVTVRRSDENPILVPDNEHPWEKEATFNGCPIVDKSRIHFLYRAVSSQQHNHGADIQLSTIGYASSKDGVHFSNRKQFIFPEYDWEKFGCEDPRVTKIAGTYYIFYTALSNYPFNADGIKIGVALTKDFKKIDAKYPVTFFNSKAMALFPEKVNGKFAAILTVNTDLPPAKICLALFDRIEQIWSREYWENWWYTLNDHVIPLQRAAEDHIEVGAAPLKTSSGWLMLYSYIRSYSKPPATFGIEAVLLDTKNPQKILGRVEHPLLTPELEYEQYGKVPNIVFPSGAFVKRNILHIYYGATDTTCCLATVSMQDLMKEVRGTKKPTLKLERFSGNPIITPDPTHGWEAKAAFNPAAFIAADKVHIVYRAMSNDNTSVLGYASSSDGFNIDERLPDPIYVPREEFEKKLVRDSNSGCEDPRITKMGDTLYMCYTAFDGKHPPRVALTSISVSDFVAQQWNWSKSVIISPPNVDDKDAALFPKKINGKFAIVHRIGLSIWIDFVDTLKFDGTTWIQGKVLMSPRPNKWDSRKIGIAAPPIETKEGWLMLYHGIAKDDPHYRVKAALLDLKDPMKVLARTKEPILEPLMPYEIEGQVSHVVFPCGAVLIGEDIFVYYGTADTKIGVATVKLSKLLKQLSKETIL